MADATEGCRTHDGVSMCFHWATAGVVLAVFALALVPGVVPGSVALHKTLGIALLVLVPLRAAWRLKARKGARAHALGSPLDRLSRIGAAAAHAALYALLLGVPLLGWAYVDAKGLDLHPFGLPMPRLVEMDRELAATLYAWKSTLAYGMLALIGLHAAAAIGWHGLVRRDGVLSSMLPLPRMPQDVAARAAAGD